MKEVVDGSSRSRRSRGSRVSRVAGARYTGSISGWIRWYRVGVGEYRKFRACICCSAGVYVCVRGGLVVVVVNADRQMPVCPCARMPVLFFCIAVTAESIERGNGKSGGEL